MNANIELALLTKVIETGDFKTLEKMKIDETFFSSPEAIEAYRYIRDTYRNPDTAGRTPSQQLLLFNHPTFQLYRSDDDVAVLCAQLRSLKISMDVQLLAQDLMQKAERSPLEALAVLRAESSRIGALSESSSDFSISGAVHDLRQEYEAVAAAEGVTGIPFPWAPLNEETQGMHGGDFIVIYGRPKSMKTWVALVIAMHAYVGSRRRVLVYSREMAPKKLLKRAATLLARVDYKKFTTGRLNPVERDRVFTMLNELVEDEVAAATIGGHQPQFIVCADAGGSRDAGGVSWLKSKIEEFQPDLVIVDGMYLMADDRTKSRTIDWKNITHISQDLKIAATQYNVPIIGVTQANRGADKSRGEDLTEIAFADSLGMDADAILRVSRRSALDPVTKRTTNEIIITAPGLREGIFEGIVIHGNPGTDFSFIRTLKADDAERHKEDGDSYQQPSGPPRLQGRPNFTRSGQLRDPRAGVVK